jgi:lipopolysaccharide export system permease protein
MGGRLDRYVALAFLRAFAVSLFAVLGLFVVLDLASHLDDFITRSGAGMRSLPLMAQYYTLSLPFLFLQGAPFITLGAGAYTVVRLVQTNEWMAVLGSGISSRRMLAPVVALALGLAGLILGFRDVVTEGLAQQRDLVWGRLVWGEERPWADSIWVRDRLGRPFFVRKFQMHGEATDEATIEGLEADLFVEDQWTRFHAEKAHFRHENGRGQWTLEGARLESEDAARQRELSPEKLVLLDFEPRDVLAAAKMSRDPEKLSSAEIRDLVTRDPDNMQLRTIEQNLWAYPFANVIFLLVGLPLTLSAEKRRVLRGVLFGVLACFLYFVFDFVCRSLGMEGALSPLLAGWMPAVLFGSAGIVLTSALST